jgi:hypothetical protein
MHTSAIRGATRLFQLMQVPEDKRDTVLSVRDAMRGKSTLHETSRFLADAYLRAHAAPKTPENGRRNMELAHEQRELHASYVRLRNSYNRVPSLKAFTELQIVNDVRLTRSVELPHFVAPDSSALRQLCIVCGKRSSTFCRTCCLPMHNNELSASGMTCEMYYHTCTNIAVATPARNAASRRNDRNKTSGTRQDQIDAESSSADEHHSDDDTRLATTTPLGAAAGARSAQSASAAEPPTYPLGRSASNAPTATRSSPAPRRRVLS